MMKLFRKYNKHILAAIMILLMIVFVGGSALDNLLRAEANYSVAHSKLGDITTLDQRRAEQMTNILTNLGRNWRQPAGNSKPLELVDWILLTREAEKYDLGVSPQSSRAFLGAEISDDDLRRFALRSKTKTDAILAAVGEFRAVQLAAQAISAAALPSEAEVRAAARSSLDKVTVNAVVLPGAAFAVDDNTAFSEQEIEKQWAPYKDVKPGEGLNFGYFLPHKLAVQFITIDKGKIAEKIGIPNLEKKARAYYDEHRAEFLLTTPPPPAEEGKPAPSPFQSWEEAKENAIAKVRQEAARGAAERIADWLQQAASEPFIDVQRGADGYKPAPEAVADIRYYEELVKQVPASIAFEGAVVESKSSPFTEDEAEDVPLIGTAEERVASGLGRTFKQLVFMNQGVVPKLPEEEAAGRSEFVSVNQTFPHVLTDQAGNLIVFRVYSVEDGRPSESSFEVRQRVIDDLKLLKGMERAREKAELMASAWPDKLEDTYHADFDIAELQAREDGPKPAFVTVPGVSRALPGMGELASGVYTGAALGNVPREQVSEWFKLEHTEPPTTVQELKDQAAVIVVEWVSTHSAHEGEFMAARTQIVQQLTSRRMQDALQSWLDPDNVRARNEFELVR